jgi:hypothetical protein
VLSKATSGGQSKLGVVKSQFQALLGMKDKGKFQRSPLAYVGKNTPIWAVSLSGCFRFYKRDKYGSNADYFGD